MTQDGYGTWDGERIMFKWEIEQLITDLNSSNIKQESHDRVIWATEDGVVFSVKSTYRALQTSTLSSRSQAMEMLWNIKVVPNALMLAWRVLKGKVPTRTNL